MLVFAQRIGLCFKAMLLACLIGFTLGGGFVGEAQAGEKTLVASAAEAQCSAHYATEVQADRGCRIPAADHSVQLDEQSSSFDHDLDDYALPHISIDFSRSSQARPWRLSSLAPKPAFHKASLLRPPAA